MGVCLSPGSICKDKASAINVHRSIGLESQSLRKINEKISFFPKYNIQDIGYKIKINLVFFCNNNILKNSFTYKFQLYIDNSELEEENYISLGSTEAMICQNKIEFNKIFETNYFFSKGQRIKISCLENEKNINTSSFYLGKMLNLFENPKLIIEKENETIGELLIVINKEENQKLFKNKKCFFSIELSNKVKIEEEENYFFCIKNGYNEIIYKSKEFINKKNNIDYIIYKFSFEIRKHFIFYRTNSITINLFSIKNTKINNSYINNKIAEHNNDIEKNNENKNFNDNINIKEECELIGSIDISNEELLQNNGINSFKLTKGILSSFFKESIKINISYKENDYTPFLEYIRFQLHLNLILIFNNNILKNKYNQIKNIISSFFSIISLYDNEEKKIAYLKRYKNFSIEKANNIKECLNEEEINDNNKANNINNKEEGKMIPILEVLLKKYISLELKRGINKYFMVLIFTNNKFYDINEDEIELNDNSLFYKKYENIPLNFKIFNLDEENNYNESNNINMNISYKKNGDIKYQRIIFQYYNLNSQNIRKEKGNKYLNDIPFLIEDFFEIQKLAKYSIFDE